MKALVNLSNFYINLSIIVEIHTIIDRHFSIKYSLVEIPHILYGKCNQEFFDSFAKLPLI